MQHQLASFRAGGVAIEEFPPEKTSLVVTARLWNRAKLAIAPHGAGLVNMIFLPPKSTVVEIIARGQTGDVYRGMAGSLGHTYVRCEYSHPTGSWLSRPYEYLESHWARGQEVHPIGITAAWAPQATDCACGEARSP